METLCTPCLQRQTSNTESFIYIKIKKKKTNLKFKEIFLFVFVFGFFVLKKYMHDFQVHGDRDTKIPRFPKPGNPLYNEVFTEHYSKDISCTGTNQ